MMVDQIIRELVQAVAAAFGEPIVGVIKDRNGTVLMKWRWNSAAKKPERVGD